jgi:CubicO group peptidase (beta-lactamase class C family)
MRFAAIVAFACLSFATAAAAQTADEVIAKAMAGHSKVPAMAVLVIRNGGVTEEAVRGVRAMDAPDKAAPGDVWHLGSDSKAMTATMIARLVERGVLSWDAPLETLLPDLAADMRPEYRKVTLVQLLSHTAGLPENADFAFIKTFYDDPRPLPEQRLTYARRALTDAPIAPPGTKVSYSNSGLMIAAVVAERATGRSFEELMREEVFGPLGMTTAGFGPTHRGQPLGHEAGKPLTGNPADNPLAWAPAGGMHMSLRDWSKFAIDQMEGEQGGGKLLRRETYAYLHTPVLGASALGWGVVQNKFGVAGRLLQHAGSNGDWFALIGIVPELHDGVLVATNAAEDAEADKAAREAFEAIIATFPQVKPSGP